MTYSYQFLKLIVKIMMFDMVRQDSPELVEGYERKLISRIGINTILFFTQNKNF
jgi:hypothetical protein